MPDEPADPPPGSSTESHQARALEALLRRTSAGGREQDRSVPRWVAASVMVVAVAVGWLGWQWVGRPSPIEERMPMAAAEATDVSPPGQSAATETGSDGDRVVVHVAGAVLDPGVVTLEAGARIGDAVGAAGGLAPNADLERLNLAAPLDDGARVFVPTPGQEVPEEVAIELPVTGGGGTGDSPVDLNRADAAALEELPGVGPATASAILAYREQHGDFSTVDELLEVRGIGEAKLEGLAGLVVVR